MADAQDSKSCEGNFMWVQVPPSAPRILKNGFNLFFLFILLNQGTFTLYSGPRQLRCHPKYTAIKNIDSGPRRLRRHPKYTTFVA